MDILYDLFLLQNIFDITITESGENELLFR